VLRPRPTPCAYVLALCSLVACTGDDAQPATSASSSSGAATGVGTPPQATNGDDAVDSSGAISTTQTAEETGDQGSTTADSGASSTGDVTGSSGSTGSTARCPVGHECFFLDGVFHTADVRTPVLLHNMDVQADLFATIEVELDFVHGGWYADDPAGLHNIFWLQRGQVGNFTWAGGVAGYVNTRGPNTNIIRTRHDLDVTDLADSQTFNINGITLNEGSTYHVLYRLDTTRGEVLVELTEGADVIASGTDTPTTDAVRNDDNGFFIAFGNPTDVELPGPEVPSLGWSFSDLRVEFIP